MILSTYRRRLENRPRNAFTLLEVLVVVAIIVILASVASVSVFGYLENAKKDKAKLQAKAIENAAKAYILRYNAPPPTAQALISPGNGEKALLEGGLEAITTPWGGQFQLSEGPNPNNQEEMAIIVQWQDGDSHPHNNFEKIGQGH